MKFNVLFPVVIGRNYDLKFANRVLPIAQKLLNEADITLLGYKSSYGNYNTSLEIGKHKFIIEKIKQLSIEYINELKYDIPTDVLEYDFFVSRMEERDGHDLHQHPNSILSGVVYLNIQEGSAPIQFYDPKQARHYGAQYQKTETNILNQEVVEYYVKNGDILIWEGWLPHKVPRNFQLKGIRETLIFNVYWPKV